MSSWAEEPVRSGDFEIMLYASVNRDDTVFGPTAASFDIARSITPTHVAFGFGEHLCLGAALARLEARVFFEEFLARSPTYDLVGPVGYVQSTLARGAVKMPMVLAGPRQPLIESNATMNEGDATLREGLARWLAQR